MKRRNLCIAFLILSALCVPLFLTSSDVSALRHNVNKIPIARNTSLNSAGGEIYNPPFEIYWFNNSNAGIHNAPNIRMKDEMRYFSSTYNESINKCNYNGTRGWYRSYDDTSFQISLMSYLNVYNTNNYNYDWARCLQVTPFGATGEGNIPHPEFNENSFYGLTPVTTAFYKSLLPYYFDFDYIYLKDEQVSTTSGLHYKSTLKMSDVTFGTIPNKFLSMTIPLGSARTNVTGDFTNGREVKFDGVFRFPGISSLNDPQGFSWSPLFLQHGKFRLIYEGFTESDIQNGTSTRVESDCTLKTTLVDPGGGVSPEVQVSFDCPTTIQGDFVDNNIYFWIEFGLKDYSAQQSEYQDLYVFQTTADWTFSTAFFTTDNDSTPGGDWDGPAHGNNQQLAPGSAIPAMNNAESSNVDWTSSLTNLFGFSLINPFAPIFNLFSNQSSCAQIPTIAGMIHSNETQVCPWFSTTTRNIVTPVLGLASMMLVFGFVVRWLGARSGNLFSDSMETDNYSFSRKRGK